MNFTHSIPELSIIVAVFNIEDYIGKCIESIVNQEYKNYEIIIVNDGSTDRSPLVCQSYESKYDCIKVINQNNMGLSDARNAGLDASCGKYITFIDGDDFIEPGYLIKIMSTLSTDTDLLISNYAEYVSANNIKKGAYRIKNRYSNDVLYYAMIEKIPLTAWGKFIKRSLFFPKNDKPIRFPQNRRYEDTVVILKIIAKSNMIAIVDNAYYYYVQRKSSITHKPKQKDINDLMLNIEEIEDSINNKNSSKYKDVYICTILLFALELGHKIEPFNQELVDNIKWRLKDRLKTISFDKIVRCRRWKAFILAKLGLYEYLLKN